ncbi:hypothetical protein [Roseicella aquatilis]|uniref:Uncharacterized protein n=1 Tax=Roseicella aquatilis TaxID=2527868 RepID=A0A4R4DQC0_9PROT|nr:hypothetical protein [Roseicella aquatilis]TCZ64304.1 hypothetical protein EXY23_06540 [Roseicella aquatilis]
MPDGARLTAGPIVWTWTGHGEIEPWARVLVTLRMDACRGEARLQFDVDHYSRRTGPQDQWVMMETTLCRYGGRRWWWICAATGRRSTKLYLPNGGTRFLSRGPGAYRLAYASQNGGEMDRSHARLARLHQKMGGEYHRPDDPPPARPKWMRRRTYARLVAEWEAAVERHDDIWTAGALRLLTK